MRDDVIEINQQQIGKSWATTNQNTKISRTRFLNLSCLFNNKRSDSKAYIFRPNGLFQSCKI